MIIKIIINTYTNKCIAISELLQDIWNVKRGTCELQALPTFTYLKTMEHFVWYPEVLYKCTLLRVCGTVVVKGGGAAGALPPLLKGGCRSMFSCKLKDKSMHFYQNYFSEIELDAILISPWFIVFHFNIIKLIIIT
jgi:hypothetical protein